MEVLFRSPLGALLARPWVDKAGLFGLGRWYFPLSRLWAAANAAGEDTARWREEIGAPLAAWPEPYLRSVLARHAARKLAVEAAGSAWEASLFDDVSDEEASSWIIVAVPPPPVIWRRAPPSIRCCFRHDRRRGAG